MSRGQENQVFDTSQEQNETAAKNAQTSFNNAQTDVGNYEDQLSKFAAGNPYVKGGELETDQNKVLSNTADAGARAAGQALQSAAVRTGQNAGGAIAATEAMQQENERNLAEQEAKANQQRIGAEAGYNKDVLGATEIPATLEAGLTGQQLGAQSNALSDQEKAASTPSTADAVFGDILQAGSSAAKAFAK